MKILHIINSLATGGAEKLILETLPLYAERGLTADLLLLNGVEHPFLEELREKNCCLIFSLGKTSVYNPLLIFKIIPYLKNYDLVHVHLFPAQYHVVLAKILSRSSTKLIFTEHSTSNRRMTAPAIKYLDLLFYKSYTIIIAISVGGKAALIKHLKSEEKIEILQNGVNLEKVHTAPLSYEVLTSFPNKSIKLILQVAGFRIEKDQETVIRSLLHLPTNYNLLLVGDGERKKELSDLVERLNLQNRVHFLGVRTDVFSILKTIDFVVVSSHWEGFGLVAVEGMAARKPVIASNVPGLNEVVAEAGILFPLGNEKMLAEEILHLANDSTYYNKIATQCFNRAKEFDISNMVNKHIALYQELTQK